MFSAGCLYSLDWTTGLDYWTDLFATKNHFYTLQLDSLACSVASYVILVCYNTASCCQMPFWLQMVSKWVGPITSGEQPCNQEVAVQLTFCLNRSFYLRISLVTNFREWCNASLPAFARSCTARNPACCYPELSILRHTPCHKLVTWLCRHHLAHLRQVCLATVEWQLVAATRLQLSSYGTSLDFYVPGNLHLHRVRLCF